MEKRKMLTGNLFVPVVLLALIGSLTQTIGKAVGYALLYVILIDPILSRFVSYRAIKTAFSTATLFSLVFVLIGRLIDFNLLSNSFPIVWLLTFVMVFIHANSSLKTEEQQRRWEDIFNDLGGGFTWTYTTSDQFDDFFKDFQNQGGYYGGGYSGSQNQGGYSGYQPGGDFISQYKGACDLLGVPTTADKYEIKLAYKKMAKKYHPDINKSENSTEMFQKINAAYEFLSDENINRYKSMTNQ